LNYLKNIREKNMKQIICITLIIFVFLNLVFPQNVKYETRAAWIATVVNLDWPKSGSTTSQKNELVSMFNKLKETGINAVIFQIRSEADAMYNSEYEPWSYWLTGSQGTAPDPYYDPLEFAVEEAHKLGLELHAWFNPYRAERDAGNYTTSPEHVTNQHPDWIIQIGNIKVLDPGLPMVREHVSTVIMDVVNRYNVDGVHFDDYFYPYPPNQISNEDSDTFADFSRGFSNIGDWRRDNVNLLVEMIFDSIQVIKPNVKFGISPFGIWKNGVPSGIVGLDAYNVIYCDAMAWLQNQTIDYLTPQLYWRFGGGQDYGKLLPWWADSTGFYDRHLSPGQAAYRLHPDNGNWPLSEIVNQIELNRETADVYGSVFFRATQGITDDLKGFASELKNTFYRYPSIIPSMDWKETQPPNPPNNLTYQSVEIGEPNVLLWERPDIAADGDSASRYVVYRFEQEPTEVENLSDPTKILHLTGIKQYSPDVPEVPSDQYYYLVTSLDQNNNESDMSNIIILTPPAEPQLIAPQDLAINQSDTLTLSWNHAEGHLFYNIQVATDSDFSTIIIDQSAIEDSFLVITDLLGQQDYFWHVSTSNGGGTGDYSSAYSFRTGFPVIPVLATPENGATDLPLETTLFWYKADSAASYRLQFTTSEIFFSRLMILDTILADTMITVEDLSSYTIYYWRTLAINDYGASTWSEPLAFRTIDVSSIEEEISAPLVYHLKQNYPNPFNPRTTIEYSIAQAGFVRLEVYDVLGRSLVSLIKGQQSAGRYKVSFDASDFPSGVYIYYLISKDFRESKKMILVK
jgi:uncharacterized lipoprotein YddW (UPF0748 family)